MQGRVRVGFGSIWEPATHESRARAHPDALPGRATCLSFTQRLIQIGNQIIDMLDTH